MTKKPPLPVSKRVNVTEALAARIDDFRFGRRIANEGEAIRQLIEAGLDVMEKRAVKGPKGLLELAKTLAKDAVRLKLARVEDLTELSLETEDPEVLSKVLENLWPSKL